MKRGATKSSIPYYRYSQPHKFEPHNLSESWWQYNIIMTASSASNFRGSGYLLFSFPTGFRTSDRDSFSRFVHTAVYSCTRPCVIAT